MRFLPIWTVKLLRSEKQDIMVLSILHTFNYNVTVRQMCQIWHTSDVDWFIYVLMCYNWPWLSDHQACPGRMPCATENKQQTSVIYIFWSVFDCNKLPWGYCRRSIWLPYTWSHTRHHTWSKVCTTSSVFLDMSSWKRKSWSLCKNATRIISKVCVHRTTSRIWHHYQEYAMVCTTLNRTYPFNFIWCNYIPIFNKVNLNVKKTDNTWTFKLQ